MKTQSVQGSFITLIGTFVAKAEELSDLASKSGVTFHPRAEAAINLPVLRLPFRRVQDRLDEENCPSERVFRYRSSNPCAPSCACDFFGGLPK